jgi:hypothetical protein
MHQTLLTFKHNYTGVLLELLQRLSWRC